MNHYLFFSTKLHNDPQGEKLIGSDYYDQSRLLITNLYSAAIMNLKFKLYTDIPALDINLFHFLNFPAPPNW